MNHDGATPLMSARHRKHDEVVALLESYVQKAARRSTPLAVP